MKQKHLNFLLFVLIAACTVCAVSCGVSSSTNSWDETGKFLFVGVDKKATSLLFLLSGIVMVATCALRLYFKLCVPGEYDFYQMIGELDESGDKELDQGAETSTRKAIANSMKLSLLLARICPVMMFWSWFIDSNARKFLYWLLVILTSAALRYGTELLGIDMWNFRRKWSVIWCIICVVGYIILL